ncbi:MAG: hypothetical protein M3N46_01085 [Actinomycetota bacterium]|nr:hypothetical protein [Actinomycetota bacterium]
MASTIEFELTGDAEGAKQLVLAALSNSGWTVNAKDAWNFEITRGSKGKSLWLGAMAGKDFYIPFSLGFSSDPNGHLVARLSRDSVMGAVRGGAIGASKAATVFGETADTIGAAATSAGIFAATRNIG